MAGTKRTGRAAGLAVAAAMMVASVPGPAALAQDASASPGSAPPSAAAPVASEVPAGAWPATALPGAMAITATADRFVAVGSDGPYPGRAQAWTSTDGLTWEPATVTDAAEGTVMTAVTPTDNGLVAVGTSMRDEDFGPDRVATWSSTDGQTWLPASVRRPAARGLSAGVSHVADGPGGTIALTSFFGQDMPRSRLYRTIDGLAWEPIQMPQPRDVVWSALRAIPGGYLLIGNTTRGRPATFRSDDGEAWERVRDAPWILDAAAAPDGTIVAIADDEVLTTSDLVTWEQVMEAPGAEPDADTPALNMIVWDGARFVSAGITFEGCPEGVDECYQTWLSTSPDGRTWTDSSGPDGLAGPDDATQFAGIATLDDTTVVLGFAGSSPKTAWIVPA